MFSEILEQRASLSERLRANVADCANSWGVIVERVQMKKIDLVDQNMVRAMAKEAEAIRERTAAIIRADGELQVRDFHLRSPLSLSLSLSLSL